MSTAPMTFIQHFRTHGILVHSTTCHGQFCSSTANDWFVAAMQAQEAPLPVEKDCGPSCAAFTFQHASIPLVPFSFPQMHTGFALVYSAGPDLWDHVQCAAVTDSSTSSRACCKCGDPKQCPWRNKPFLWSEENPGTCIEHQLARLRGLCG